MKYQTATISTTNLDCSHSNGWFYTVRFWIFSKEVFYCKDCKRLLEAKQVRKQWHEEKE